MSAIPPDIAASAAQAGFAAREASRQRDADRTAQSQAREQQTKAVDEAADSVETTDGDTAVFADAEGAGSQGRATDQEVGPEEEQKTVHESDSAGSPRLDIQA